MLTARTKVWKKKLRKSYGPNNFVHVYCISDYLHGVVGYVQCVTAEYVCAADYIYTAVLQYVVVVCDLDMGGGVGSLSCTVGGVAHYIPGSNWNVI